MAGSLVSHASAPFIFPYLEIQLSRDEREVVKNPQNPEKNETLWNVKSEKKPGGDHKRGNDTAFERV